MPIDDATWANVRRAYVDGSQSVKQICTEFGIDTFKLYARARQDQWPKRLAKILAARTAAKAVAQPSDAISPADPDSAELPLPSNQRARSALIRRLYKAIDTKLKQMEKLMASAAETSPADHERETRTLSTLIRNFERVSEFDPDLITKPAAAHTANAPAGSSSSPNSAASPSSADAERLGRDIAERLVRIHEQRRLTRDAG
jgi:hypothetical protein